MYLMYTYIYIHRERERQREDTYTYIACTPAEEWLSVADLDTIHTHT